MNTIDIIETNLSGPIGEYNTIEIIDHQSRIVKCNNWNDYVSAYLSPENEELRDKLPVRTLPRQCKISNLNYDDFHLSCVIDNGKYLTYRLAYIEGSCF